MSTLVQTLPYELLGEIFRHLDLLQRDSAIPGLVCKHWRRAVLGDAQLWTEVRIDDGDVQTDERQLLVRDILARSKRCTLFLLCKFRGPNTRAYYDALDDFLNLAIKPNLWKVTRLMIIASQHAWPVIISAFQGQRFPILGVLCLRNDAAKVVHKLYSDAHYDLWQIPETLPIPEIDDLPGTPLLDLVFPLPANHKQLFYADLQGISLTHVPLPDLDTLHISHFLPKMIVKRELDEWIFKVKDLRLSCMYIPAIGVGMLDVPAEFGWEERREEGHDSFLGSLGFPGEERFEYGDVPFEDVWGIAAPPPRNLPPPPPPPPVRPPSPPPLDEEEQPGTIEYLELTQLSAEPVQDMPLGLGFDLGDMAEHDCAPFFRRLVARSASSLEHMLIRAWHPDSRIWKDFVRVCGPQSAAAAAAPLGAPALFPAAFQPEPSVEFPLLETLTIIFMPLPRAFEDADLVRLFRTMPTLSHLNLFYQTEPRPGNVKEQALSETEKAFCDACVRVLEEDAVLCPLVEDFWINNALVARKHRRL
ncbi:F-box domain-containing protein [Mycena kentingensis (nom. inval.)]|nr:F-box domain-containing protein [Mycena kentingensis (nom. inval.)]